MTTAVNASPHGLFRRLAVNFVDCSDERKAKLETALADAAALANIAVLDIDTSSTAFTHYLREEDADMAKGLWSMVAANNDPTNAPYTFSVRCGKRCPSGSLAITDSVPQDGNTPREMLICPYFFKAAETKNNLDSKKYTADGWCKSGQHFSDFETAGHTILHEMTHLDAVGKSAGLPERDYGNFKSHGTDDLDSKLDYVAAARDLLKGWVEDPDSFGDDALKPYQNAENIAAAATEWWFIKSCKFTEIDL
ncbi:hypothetical protein DIS24_g6748 [Lasiodiplodia hormozganensis]|uniref:Lysine-specific metallo-endopeptidase domain-containing protein n=3 Tax=Lasiodiplodia TaxID=66739 RepID=A0A5N5DA29_9PEZI|nr:hypothetical protein DBV05_g6858 [Lasiodiplodia theobromae]KAK0650545.1 hypothetical protein DIS24_g6748 [Lasiodiplodia hormozganensis]